MKMEGVIFYIYGKKEIWFFWKMGYVIIVNKDLFKVCKIVEEVKNMI